MKKPLLVVTGDVHFTINSLELASKALIQAFDLANELQIPLVINGDLTDGKSIIRGEVANRLIDIFKRYQSHVKCFVSSGNHDLLSEKDDTVTAINFLSPYCDGVLTSPLRLTDQIGIIPYRNTNERFLEAVSEFDVNTILLVHQGLSGASMGDYSFDKSSVSPESLEGRRIIASHYHRKQDIDLTGGGLWSYIGSPYSITAGEATDGPKGIAVLYSDGSLEHIPTNLRKHVTIEIDYTEVTNPIPNLNSDDLLWLKVQGPHSELEKLSKRDIGMQHLGHSNFKFDKLPNDSTIAKSKVENLSDEQTLDFIVDSSEETKEQQTYLKNLWREIL